MMQKLWVVTGAVVTALSMAALAAPGCSSDPCEELADLCSTCPNPDYVAQCEQTVAAGIESPCEAQVNAFDAYCRGMTVPDGGTGGSLPGCPDGEVLCAGVCVDPATDPANCGSCGTVCSGDTPYCALGTCAAECPEPLTQCSGSCVYLQNDPDNCGACSAACSGGTPACQQGQCVAGCDPAGFYPTDCAGSCVNLALDPLHCGSCGGACGLGQLCSAGSCQGTCTAGLTLCCGLCVQTLNNPESCGGCDPELCPSGAGGAGGGAGAAGVGGAGGAGGGQGGGGGAPPAPGACAPGEVCLEGQCADDCGEFFEDCGGGCVDVRSDPFNCGACGVAVLPGEVCSDGLPADTCEPGETTCQRACVDTTANTLHCGECGHACAASEVCSQGSCLISCEAGLTECPPGSGGCVDTDTNPEHCGGCSIPCEGATPLCSDGVCVSGCPPDKTNCFGACVDLDTNFNHCGACGNSCNDQSICTVDSCDGQGKCVNNSAALVCNDGNQCTEDKCDPAKGCYSTPLSQQQVAQLCGGASPTTCVYCDPDGATCNVVPLDDGIACTDDACPPTGLLAPINVPNNANCTETCAPVCDPQGSNVDPATGCVQNSSLCTTGSCASQPGTTCDIDNPSADACGCI